MGSFFSSEYNAPKLDPAHFPAVFAGLPAMEGKTVAITGSTSGTGLCLAEHIVQKGARVIMLNRPSERATAALARVKEAAPDAALVSHVDCDLMDFASVRAAGEALVAAGNGIDVLVNNAGIMATADEATGDGYDKQMQTNHLSHFLLTALVWPLLERAAAERGEARVVNHSSGARRGASRIEAQYLGKNGGNLGGDKNNFIPFTGPRWKRYAQTKLVNLGFTFALHDRIAAAGPNSPSANIRALCAHPGLSATQLQVKNAGGGMGHVAYKILMKLSQSVEDGTLGILRCTADEIPSGSLVGPNGITGPAVVLDLTKDRSKVPNESCDELWRLSQEATGVTGFFDASPY